MSGQLELFPIHIINILLTYSKGTIVNLGAGGVIHWEHQDVKNSQTPTLS
jgi:hypothetical protein